MTVLRSIAGELSLREPNVGISLKYKVIYIAYHFLLQPTRISSNRNVPVQQHMMIDAFKQRLEGYGFDINNLSGWQLLIDARDDYWVPHKEAPILLDYLKSIFDDGHITIFSNSVYEDPKVGINIEYWPCAAANLYGYYDDLCSANIDWKNIDVNKHFIVLARRPTKKRVLFVKSLLDSFSGNILASCGSRENTTRRTILVQRPQNVVGVPTNTNTTQQPAEPRVCFDTLFAPYNYPLEIDGQVDDKKQHGVNGIFFTALVNVIAETMENDDQPVNISEKTFKAFAWHQIPIWHSVYGTVNEVRKMGFDLFDDIIDHSYDDEPDYETRKEMILTQLVLFKRKFDTISSINNLRQQIMDRLEKNNKILSQIVEYERPLEVKNLFKSSRKA